MYTLGQKDLSFGTWYPDVKETRVAKYKVSFFVFLHKIEMCPFFCFQFQGVDYFTWADRQGVDHPLVPTNLSCNLKSPAWMSNQGEVTNISQLPITNIKYGPLRFELESVKVVVGPIVCQPSENAFSIREQILANQIEELKTFDTVIEKTTESQIEELKDFDKVIKDENENLKKNVTRNLNVVTEEIEVLKDFTKVIIVLHGASRGF